MTLSHTLYRIQKWIKSGFYSQGTYIYAVFSRYNLVSGHIRKIVMPFAIKGHLFPFSVSYMYIVHAEYQ